MQECWMDGRPVGALLMLGRLAAAPLPPSHPHAILTPQPPPQPHPTIHTPPHHHASGPHHT